MRKCFLIAACVSIVAIAGSADAGLVAYWNFDETGGTTLTDSVGGNNGTLLNNVTEHSGTVLPIWRPTSGISGSGALRFSSVNQDMVIVPDFNYGDSGNFTTSIWTKADTATPNPSRDWQYFWSTGNFAENGAFNYYLINETAGDGTAQPADMAGLYRTRISEDSGASANENTTFPAAPDSGAWRMMTVSYSTTEGAKFYVNGVLEATKADILGPVGSSGKDMYFGSRADGNTTRLYGTVNDFATAPDDGLLDDAAIWDVTLNAAQVMDVYTNGVTSNPVPEPTTLALFLLATTCTAALRRRRVS